MNKETVITEVEGDLSNLDCVYKISYEHEYKRLAEYVYKRDKNGNKDKTRPVGCLFAYRDEDGSVRFGWSAYKEKWERYLGNRFDKDEAAEIAIRRAAKGRFYRTEDVPFSLHKELPKFLKRCERYFKEFPVNTEHPSITTDY